MEEIIIPTMTREEVEEYRARLGHYIIIMCYYKKMMDDGLITMEEYDHLERIYLTKYRINEKSLYRMDLKSIAETDKFIYDFKKWSWTLLQKPYNI